MKVLTVEVRERPVASSVRSTRGCRLVDFASSSRDLLSFFELVPLVLLRRRISALLRLPPVLVGSGAISQFILDLFLSLSETSEVSFRHVGELFALGYDLKRAVQLMLRKPVVVWKASGTELLRKHIEVSEIPKRTSAALRAVARADSLKAYPCFYVDKSWAAELVDQLAAFVLDLFQNFHVVVACSIHGYSPVHRGPVETRFVRHGMVGKSRWRKWQQ
jgi:hypothetical protein